MTVFVEFHIDRTDSLEVALLNGISGYAVEFTALRGVSMIWLLLGDGSVLKIHSKMTDISGWIEVGVLVFKMLSKQEDRPQMSDLPETWRSIASIKKLVVTNEGYSAESGLLIASRWGEKFVIVCSANVYQIEIAAPFFKGDFFTRI